MAFFVRKTTPNLPKNVHKIGKERTKFRLASCGTKDYKTYRIVVAKSRSKRDKLFYEQVGFYNPNEDKYGTKYCELNVERIKYFLSIGTGMSDTVGYLFGRAEIIPMPPKRHTPLKDARRKIWDARMIEEREIRRNKHK